VGRSEDKGSASRGLKLKGDGRFGNSREQILPWTANPCTAVRFRFRPPPRELLNTGKMRRISIGLAALGLAVVIGAPLHGATAEEDAASSRLVPGGYLQPRRVPDADPSPVLRSGLPKPKAAEPDPVATAPPIRPSPRIALPAHHPRPAPVRRAPPSDGKVQF
jgi:hypothetical protein